MSAQCQVCTGRSELFLCNVCQRELREMLIGLATGTATNKLTGEQRPMAGWLELLADAAHGKTRLGESARRSSEKGSPMLHNERASDLLNNVHDMLIRWVEAVNVGTETLAIPGEQ